MHAGLLPHILAKPSDADEARHAVMEGIINTMGLTDAQSSAIEGIVGSTLPEGRRHKTKVLTDATVRPVGMLAEPNKTQTRIGLVRFQGSKFH